MTDFEQFLSELKTTNGILTELLGFAKWAKSVSELAGRTAPYTVSSGTVLARLEFAPKSIYVQASGADAEVNIYDNAMSAGNPILVVPKQVAATFTLPTTQREFSIVTTSTKPVLIVFSDFFTNLGTVSYV